MAINKIGIDLIKEALDRYPDHATMTLAKALYKKNPKIWTSLDSCRSSIRYYRGAIGEEKSLKIATMKYVRPKGTPHNPMSLPPSDEKKFIPFLIEGSERIGVLSDIHVPFHNNPALTCALEHFKKRQVDTILLNGDTIDFYALSRFEKDPRERDTAYELKMVGQLLEYIREKFPKVRLIWKDGNHDERWMSYMRVKAPELLDIPQFQFSAIMKFKERGMEYVTDKRLILAGGLTILHGHEYRQAILAPVNAARGFFLKAKASTLTGHLHQSSEHTEPTVRGKMITCFSAGALCDLHPAYMPLNRWNHGFAVVTLNKEDFEVENRRIHDGKLL